MSEDLEQTPQPSEAVRWEKNTRLMRLGVVLATALLLLYNVLLFLPARWDNNEGQLSSLVGFVVFFVLTLLLVFLCIRNYSRGLSRFATLFERGGKRSLFLLRWGFWLTIAGVALQLLIFFMIVRSAEHVTFWWIVIGNVLLIAATIVSIVGFLALATSKGMPDDARRGAAHMAWVSPLLLVGACLLSFAVLPHEQGGTMLKGLALVVNLIGTYFYYTNWKRLLNYQEPEAEIIDGEAVQ